MIIKNKNKYSRWRDVHLFYKEEFMMKNILKTIEFKVVAIISAALAILHLIPYRPFGGESSITQLLFVDVTNVYNQVVYIFTTEFGPNFIPFLQNLFQVALLLLIALILVNVGEYLDKKAKSSNGTETKDENGKTSNSDLVFGLVFAMVAVYCLIPFGGDPSLVQQFIQGFINDFNSSSSDLQVLTIAILLANSLFILGMGFMLVAYTFIAIFVYPLIVINRVFTFFKKAISN
jgi:hypothetical protein